jgi:hypothetical protein
MLYREIIAVCSEIHTKHIDTLCGQNVELLHVKPGGAYGNRRASKHARLRAILHERCKQGSRNAVDCSSLTARAFKTRQLCGLPTACV